MTLPVPAADAEVAGATWWGSRVGGLPPAFWALWAGTLVNRLGSFIYPFLALFLTTARGLSLGQVSLVLTALGLGSAISQPIGGTLADRVGRRRTLVAGLLSAAASLLAVGAVRGVPALCVAVFVYGICNDLFRPAAQAAVVDLVGPELRPRAFALIFWAINLGFAVATTMAGFLAQHGYWLLFLGDAATSVAFAAVVYRLVPETRPERHEQPGTLRQVLRDPLMLALVAAVVLGSIAYMQAFFTLPLAVVADGLGSRGYGLIIALNGVLIVALQPLLLSALGRRGRGPLLLSASVISGVGFALTMFADTVPTHLLAVAVWTLGEILGAGQLAALVASLSPVHLRGRYMGVFGASYGVSAFLAPGLGTQVLDRLGEGPLWTGCLLVSCVSGVGLLWVARNAEGRSA